MSSILYRTLCFNTSIQLKNARVLFIQIKSPNVAKSNNFLI